MVSVLIPAHNESTVIGRLLSGLTDASDPSRPEEVIVSCNACSDNTASLARTFAGVSVLETSVAGKSNALRMANDVATSFPRIYLDADVEVRTSDVAKLVSQLAAPGVAAASLTRAIDLSRSSWPVRWYYEVWQELPSVRAGLFGRGIIGFSQAGYERLAEMPDLMADDLVASAIFSGDEKRIVPNATVVHAPWTWGDLIRRRTRATTGTQQLFSSAGIAVQTESRTTPRDLWETIARRPSNTLRMPAFLAATLIARRRASAALRKGDFSTWLRDESSRQTH